MARGPVVLETSFWTGAYRAGVLADCLARYDLLVPGAVARELTFDPGRQSREYPSQERFRELSVALQVPESEPAPIDYPHPGEAAAIALARERSAVLLCNDRRAGQQAAAHGVGIVTVPAFISFLCEERALTLADAHDRLHAIRAITARQFVEGAEAQLDRLRAVRQRATDLSRRRATASRLPNLGPHRHGHGPGDERGG